MKRYDFRFCSLAVPDDWVPVPPLGLKEPRQSPERLELRVAEEWLASPVSASDYASQQRKRFASAHGDLELVREGALPKSSLQTGAFLIFEYENEDGLIFREMWIFRSQGPQVASLALLGPSGPNRFRDQVFEAIAQSFELRGSEFLAQAQSQPLLGGLTNLPSPTADPAHPLQKFPRACVALPVPKGWEVRREEGGATVLLRSGSEIRLRRVLEHAGKPDVWFSETLQQLRATPGSLVLAYHHGALADGRRHAAILADESARSRSWTTAASSRVLRVEIADKQPLEWILRAPANALKDGQTVLEGLIAGLVFLDPAEWETCPAEDWVHLTLRGPWKVQGPGTYTHPEPFLLLQLSRQESPATLESLRPRFLDSLRRSFKVQRHSTEQETLGLFRGLEALRYSGKGRTAIQAIWVRSEADLYSCLVTGADPKGAEELFLAVVEGLRLPRMREST